VEEVQVDVSEPALEVACDVFLVHHVDAFGFPEVSVGVAADEAAYEAALFCEFTSFMG